MGAAINIPDEVSLEPDDTLPDAPAEFAPDIDVENMVAECEADPEGEKFLADLGRKVVRDYDSAYESSSEYRQRVADDWLIFTGDLPKKTWPFENCSNANVPLLMTNTLRLVARLSDEIFGDWQNVATFSAVGSTGQERQMARVLTLHTNWQLRNQIPDFARQQERGLLLFLVPGDVTCHSYYDFDRRQNRHEILTVDDFVTPYTHVSTMPDYSDVPFHVEVLRYQRHQLQAMADQWENVDEVLDGAQAAWDEDPRAVFLETMAEVQGIDTPDGNEDGTYRILWYEGWIEVPGQERDRFCQVIVDYQSAKVLKLSVHEAVDWEDKIRFDQQLSELGAFRQQQDAQAAQVHAAMGVAGEVAERHAQGALGPEHAKAAFGALQGGMPPAPMPPHWLANPDDPMAKPAPPRMVPIHLYAHAVCIEPIAGNLGLSFGRITADHQRAANTAVNQFIDQATLSNVRPLFTSDDVEFPNGLDMSPGKQIKVTGITSAQELASKLYMPDPGQANPQMVQFVELVSEWAGEVAQAPDVLSGAPGKSGETYRGIATRVEQATKQLSWFGKRYAYPFLRQIIQNNCWLNSVYLPDDAVALVVNPALGFPGPDESALLQFGKKLYQQNYTVEVRSDLRFIPDEQVMGEAMQVMEMVQQDPLLASNMLLQYTARRGVFEAMKRYDLVQLLGAPPPPSPQFGPPPMPPPPPPGVAPPGAPGAPPRPAGPVAARPPSNAPGPGGPVPQ